MHVSKGERAIMTISNGIKSFIQWVCLLCTSANSSVKKYIMVNKSKELAQGKMQEFNEAKAMIKKEIADSEVISQSSIALTRTDLSKHEAAFNRLAEEGQKAKEEGDQEALERIGKEAHKELQAIENLNGYLEFFQKQIDINEQAYQSFLQQGKELQRKLNKISLIMKQIKMDKANRNVFPPTEQDKLFNEMNNFSIEYGNEIKNLSKSDLDIQAEYKGPATDEQIQATLELMFKKEEPKPSE